jgi:hypothetical protein
MRSADVNRCDFCILLYAALDNSQDGPFHFDPDTINSLWMHMSLSKSGLPTLRSQRDGPYSRMRLFLAPRLVDRLFFRGLSLTDDKQPSWEATYPGGSFRLFHEHARLFQEWHIGLSAEISKSRHLARSVYNTDVVKDTPAWNNRDIRGHYLGEDRTNTKFFSGMGRWLSNCINKHESCSLSSGSNRVREQSPLPHRCLDVSDDGIKLLESKGSHAPYLTLSHRWDSQTEKCVTTTSNYVERCRGRDLDHLSKTFMDAIFVTRQLGYRFLWIDSICIIQKGDDGQDWRTEATKMAQYYHLSDVNIAACTNTNNPLGGFLSPRDEPIIRTKVRLPYISPRGFQQGYFYVYTTDQTPEQRFWTAVRQSPLLKRGWIFQEWILSRRLLWFTPEGVFFECQNTAEPAVTELSEVLDLSNLDAEGKVLIRLKHSFLGVGKQQSIDTWYTIVESYSGSELSYPAKDKILAISGVAQQFSDEIVPKSNSSQTTKYISGLWTQDLHHGLLWEQTPPFMPYERACEAPTWSWASLSTSVHWAERCAGTRIACEIHCNSPSGPDGGNELTTLFNVLRVRGRLLRVFVGCHFSKRDLRIAIAASDHDPQLDRRLTPKETNPAWYRVLSWYFSDPARNVAFKLPFYKDDSTPTEHEHSHSNYVDVGFERSRQNWRMISGLKPDTIGGWGSFEQLPKPSDGPSEDASTSSSSAVSNEAEEQIEVECLHISTRTVSSKAGWHFGYLNIHHPVLNVLYLQPTGWSDCGVRRYKRLGVGRIFDKEIITAFQVSKDQEIDLE